MFRFVKEVGVGTFTVVNSEKIINMREDEHGTWINQEGGVAVIVEDKAEDLVNDFNSESEIMP